MPEKVLVRGLSWLGDAVLSLPAMEALKRLWPDAALTIVAPQGLAPLWLMQPSVDSVQAFGPARRNGRLMEDLGLAVRLRREKWGSC
jgi:heptosyltransferase-2